MKRHDREYTALIHQLVDRYAGTLLELLAPIFLGRGKIADEDTPLHRNEIHQVLSAIVTAPPMDEIRQQLRAAGVQSGEQLELAVDDVIELAVDDVILAVPQTARADGKRHDPNYEMDLAPFGIKAKIPVVDDDEAENCDFVICAPKGPSPFKDNFTGNCCVCGCEIMYRWHAPRRPKKICIECAAKQVDKD